MNKEKIITIVKVILVVIVVTLMIYLGIIFTNKYKLKLDNTKPVFEVVEERNEKVTGKITSLLKKGNDISILIENSKEEAEDKVQVILSVEKTTVIKKQKLSKIEDVEIGDRVEVFYEILEGETNKTAKKVTIIEK